MHSITICIASFENRTTRTDLRLPTTATFLCFLENGMILELPPRTCAKGHKVQVALDVKHGKKELHFKATAKVVEVAQSQGERDSVSIELIGFEHSDWDWMQKIYQERQADVSALFSKLRGL